MRSIFLGTPSAAVASLAAVMDVTDVGLVITRPDRARGRSGRPTPPPVKAAALEWGIEVAQPENRDELEDRIAGSDADIGFVVAYGRILTSAMLQSLPRGFVNVHFSLLPRWRGAAPVERALLAGDDTTGVSLMKLDEGMDTGPVIAAVETPIASDETGGSLTGRLSYLGAMLIDDTVPDYLRGRLVPASQLRTGVTLAPRLERTEARIDPGWTAAHAERAIRAFNPRPGAWFTLDGVRILVHAASPSDETIDPGVIASQDGAPVLGLADGSIRLDVVQPAGKAPMAGTAWMNGRRGAGGRLDPAPS